MGVVGCGRVPCAGGRRRGPVADSVLRPVVRVGVEPVPVLPVERRIRLRLVVLALTNSVSWRRVGLDKVLIGD